MTTTMKPWSYSSLTQFETCPRRFYLTKVSKEVVEPPMDASDHGIVVHAALEHRIKEQKPLPDTLAHLEPLTKKIDAAPGVKHAELKLAIDKAFKPVDFFSPTVWARAIIDAVVVDEERGQAVTLDWKTGKRKPGSAQLMMSAALLMHTVESVDKVKTGFVWLRERKVDREDFGRDQIPAIWQEFMPRVRRLEIAHERDNWPPKPSGLCNGWCPVGRAHCEFWKERK